MAASLIGRPRGLLWFEERSAIPDRYCGVALVPAASGQISHAQLWNPVGSGKLLETYDILTGLPDITARAVTYALNAVALTTAVTTAVTVMDTRETISNVGELRRENNATALGDTFIQSRLVSVQSRSEVFRSTPVVLKPGTGIIIRYRTATNVALDVSFAWREYDE